MAAIKDYLEMAIVPEGSYVGIWEYIIPIFQSLHWLPIGLLIQIKVLVLISLAWHLCQRIVQPVPKWSQRC